jgi:hypothetical protein
MLLPSKVYWLRTIWELLPSFCKPSTTQTKTLPSLSMLPTTILKSTRTRQLTLTTGSNFSTRRSMPTLPCYLYGCQLRLFRYYSSYLKFFTEEVQSRGIAETIETYVFSPDANDDCGRMILRLIGGAYALSVSRSLTHILKPPLSGCILSYNLE